MKSHIILGAIVGFLAGAGCSLAGGCSWSTALWRAGVAALFIGMLARWWSLVWLRSLNDALTRPRKTDANAQTKKPMMKT